MSLSLTAQDTDSLLRLNVSRLLFLLLTMSAARGSDANAYGDWRENRDGLRQLQFSSVDLKNTGKVHQMEVACSHNSEALGPEQRMYRATPRLRQPRIVLGDRLYGISRTPEAPCLDGTIGTLLWKSMCHRFNQPGYGMLWSVWRNGVFRYLWTMSTPTLVLRP